VVDVTPFSHTLEGTGESGKANAGPERLQPFGIQEIVRSGTLAIARGSESLTRREEVRLRAVSKRASSQE